MPRPVDADVVRPRLHAERVEQTVVVVRDSRRACGRRRRACRCLRPDRGCRSRTSPRRRRSSRCGRHLLEIGVGAVAADAVGVEQADAEHEVVDRLRARGPSGGSPSDRRSERRTTAARRVEQRDVGDLDLARSPAPFGRLEHVRRSDRPGCRCSAAAGCASASAGLRRCLDRLAPSSPRAAALRRPRPSSGRRRRRACGSPCAIARPSSSHSASSQKRSTRLERVRDEQDRLAAAAGTRRTCRGTCA